MKAIVQDHYGPPEVLRIAEVERPIPEADHVLVRVHASTVNRTDTGFRSAELFISRFFTGLRRPKWTIPGIEFAGEVEAVGEGVAQGDELDVLVRLQGLGGGPGPAAAAADEANAQRVGAAGMDVGDRGQVRGEGRTDRGGGGLEKVTAGGIQG